MERWGKGERTVQYLVDRTRLESFEAKKGNLGELADALIGRAARRVGTTAAAALAGGDVDGAYVAAYDAYRIAAEVAPGTAGPCVQPGATGHTWQ